MCVVHATVSEAVSNRIHTLGSLDCKLVNNATRYHLRLVGVLRAIGCPLTGWFPPIGQLTQLTRLSLARNQLTGACIETHQIAIGKRVYH